MILKKTKIISDLILSNKDKYIFIIMKKIITKSIPKAILQLPKKEDGIV